MTCGSGGGQTRALREVYHFISAQQRYLNQEPSSKLFFVNILDGNKCYKKIKLFPKVEHGQIFVGSLWVQWNYVWKDCDSVGGKKCFNQKVSIFHLLV